MKPTTLVVLQTVVLVVSLHAGALAQSMNESDTMTWLQSRSSANSQFRIRWACNASSQCGLIQEYDNGGTWTFRAYVFNNLVSALKTPRIEMLLGNLIAYDDDDTVHDWSFTYSATGRNRLDIQDDGNLVIYNIDSGLPLWTPVCEFPWMATYYATLFPFDVADCP